MEILEKKINDIVVLMLKGRLDASTIKDVKEKVTSLAEEKRVKLVIDLGSVDFIDSSGLGILVASLRTVNKVGGDIKIASLQDRIRSIFELTRLHRLFDIFDDSNAAAKSF